MSGLSFKGQRSLMSLMETTELLPFLGTHSLSVVVKLLEHILTLNLNHRHEDCPTIEIVKHLQNM